MSGCYRVLVGVPGSVQNNVFLCFADLFLARHYHLLETPPPRPQATRSTRSMSSCVGRPSKINRVESSDEVYLRCLRCRGSGVFLSSCRRVVVVRGVSRLAFKFFPACECMNGLVSRQVPVVYIHTSNTHPHVCTPTYVEFTKNTLRSRAPPRKGGFQPNRCGKSSSRTTNKEASGYILFIRSSASGCRGLRASGIVDGLGLSWYTVFSSRFRLSVVVVVLSSDIHLYYQLYVE